MRALTLVAALAASAFSPGHAQVAFERAGFRLTSIGERVAVSGRVVDGSRRPVPSGSIRWRVADPSIASVTPQGVIVSRRVGSTKLWAVAGDDSASALILVDQRTAQFDFVPAALRLDAKGEKKSLRVVARDAVGQLVVAQAGKPAPCRSLNNSVATIGQNGEVTAVGPGVTYVRCVDRGVADSARVEVRQRPVRATITDKPSFSIKVYGDTFRLRVNAIDAAGEPIASVPSTWASLNPTIVSIDPLSGFARGVGTGTAKIVAQAGDATDTVSIGITQALGLPVPANSETSAETAGRSMLPTIRFVQTYPFVGDTAPVQFTVRDANGIEIQNATVRLESSDTSLFVVLSRNRILLKKEGVGHVLGHFGEVVDSGQVIVRAKAVLAVTRSDSTVEAAPFVRPTFDTLALNRAYTARRDSVNKVMFESNRLVGSRRSPAMAVSTSLAGGQSQHSFSDSTGTENRSGFVYGGIVDVRVLRYVQLTGEFRMGSLAGTGASTTELGITEAGGTAAFSMSDFAAGVMYTLRATREGASAAPLAIQQWTIPRVFVTVRPAFIGGTLRTIMSVNALVAGTYTGYMSATGDQINPQPLSLGGQAGLEFARGGFRAAMLYDVESFKFEKIGSSERRDQFSTVRVKLGWAYSR